MASRAVTLAKPLRASPTPNGARACAAACADLRR